MLDHNNDILIKPLDANMKHKVLEAENKQIFDEILEKEKYEKEYTERKNFYLKMRKKTYSKELAKLDRSPEASSVNYMSARKKKYITDS